MSQRTIEQLQMQLEDGNPLISGPTLWRSLGFSNGASFRQAKARGQLGVNIFRIPNRRGNFAFTQDVIGWLDQLSKTHSKKG